MPRERDGDGEQNAPESKWNDPSIPAGNSPPLPSWPLWVSAALWCGWTGVLLVTALGR